MAMPDRWLVLLTGEDMIDELRKLPDDILSFDAAMNQVAVYICQTSAVIGTLTMLDCADVRDKVHSRP